MTAPTLLAKRVLLPLLAGLACLLATGCQSIPAPTSAMIADATNKYSSITLREGDSVKVSFPGAPNLDTTQTVRRDGKISVGQFGDVTAVGRTPAELEKDILTKAKDELVVKQVSVSLSSSTFPVFVIGAVLRPGKVVADRPLSVFEAIMEAGGFDFARANTKRIMILREGESEMQSFELNLKETLEGKNTKPFYLKPSDVVFVREKFSWF